MTITISSIEANIRWINKLINRAQGVVNSGRQTEYDIERAKADVAALNVQLLAMTFAA